MKQDALGSMGLVVVSALLLLACTSAPVTQSDLPTRPQVLGPTSPLGEVKQAPTRASQLGAGECIDQSQCSASEVCVAIEPGLSLCQAGQRDPAASAATAGHPIPPRGLLDGQMMRDYAQRSAR